MVDLQTKKWGRLLSRISPAELSKLTGALQKVRTEQLARTFARYVLTKDGYNPVFLLSRKQHEPAGIVDLVGIRKRQDQDGRRDATEIVLFQVKGNGKVSESEKGRLQRAVDKVHVRAATIEYKPGELPSIQMLPESNISPELTRHPEAAPDPRSLDTVERHLLYDPIVAIEPLRNSTGKKVVCAARVDPKRSEAAKRAWVKIRRNQKQPGN